MPASQEYTKKASSKICYFQNQELLSIYKEIFTETVLTFFGQLHQSFQLRWRYHQTFERISIFPWTIDLDGKRKIIWCDDWFHKMCWGLQTCWNLILYQFSFKWNEKNVCLYRNDGLAVFKTIIGLQAEKMEIHFRNNSVKMI